MHDRGSVFDLRSQFKNRVWMNLQYADLLMSGSLDLDNGHVEVYSGI